ncbi:MAG: two-component regulator propeller domain-containing protein [Bacteroidia bacterium]
MQQHKLLFTLFFLLSCFNVCNGQLSNMHFDLINEANGISNHSVGNIAQDKDGYMWFATADGLNRFDGYSFKVFRKIIGDSNSIQGNYLSRLAVDYENKLWIGLSPSGLSCFDPVTEKFTNYRHDEKNPQSISENSVNRIFIDRKNNVWVSLTNNGISLLDRKTKTFKRYGPLPGINPGYTPSMKKKYNTINNISEDETGLFWMTTSDGLYTFNPADGKFIAIRAQPIVAFKWRDDAFGALYYDGNDGYWMGAWGGGMSKYNRKTKEWNIFKYDLQNPQSGTHNIVFDIKFKNDSELWVATSDRGLGIFNTRSNSYSFLNKKSAYDANFPTETSIEIFIDNWNNMWIADIDGISFSRANATLFNYAALPVTRSDNGKYYSVGYIHKDIQGKKLYLTTAFADGLNVLDEKTNSLKHFTFKIKEGEEKAMLANDVMQDSKGSLWVITRDYIFLFDKENEKLVEINQPPVDTGFKRSPFFMRAYEDSKHRIWLTSLRHGVYVYDTEKKAYIHFLHDDKNTTSICSDNISGASEDKFHRLWFCSTVSGVSRYNDSCNCFTNFIHDENDTMSLPNNIVPGICSDSKGQIWLATYGGVSSIQTRNNGDVFFKNYTVRDGLPSESINEIICDNNDNVWFNSPSGLSQMDVETKSVRTYTAREGLGNNYINYSLSMSGDGEIFIGAGPGYTRFYPDKIIKSQISPKVVINSFKIFDKSFPYKEQLLEKKRIELTWKENFFAFEFAALNFSDPEKNQYAYMLEGFDKDWIYCGNRRYASYTNLNGGNYVFKLKASNSDGVWSKNEITIPIHIDPPFWKRPWFILLSIVLVSLLIYGLYKYRISQIRRTEKLKTDFNKKIAQVEMRALRAQMNPHFVFNCLNSINRYIVKSDTKTASLYLTKFAKLIRLILDNSESANVTLHNELEALKLYIEMESIRFENKFSYEIKTSDDLNMESIHVPPLIVQPYVENAIWHGLLNKETGGKLTVDVRRNNGALQFIVEDDGVGRAKAKELKSKSATTRKSLGMKLTEDRIAILNEHTSEKSSVEIIDSKDANGMNSGTKVIIRIPISEN